MHAHKHRHTYCINTIRSIHVHAYIHARTHMRDRPLALEGPGVTAALLQGGGSGIPGDLSDCAFMRPRAGRGVNTETDNTIMKARQPGSNQYVTNVSNQQSTDSGAAAPAKR